MSAAKKSVPRFRVGDWVSLWYGTRQATAQVIEDRGPLGVNGRRLYRIRLGEPFTEPIAFEMPEEELTHAAAPDKSAVLHYLREGGLLAILQANLVRQPEQPRAWLTFTARGDVAHTFAPDQGILGGDAVPYFALHEDKVFTGKKRAVAHFLTSFGLTEQEAEEVIDTVGTAP